MNTSSTKPTPNTGAGNAENSAHKKQKPKGGTIIPELHKELKHPIQCNEYERGFD